MIFKAFILSFEMFSTELSHSVLIFMVCVEQKSIKEKMSYMLYLRKMTSFIQLSIFHHVALL